MPTPSTSRLPDCVSTLFNVLIIVFFPKCRYLHHLITVVASLAREVRPARHLFKGERNQKKDRASKAAVERETNASEINFRTRHLLERTNIPFDSPPVPNSAAGHGTRREGSPTPAQGGIEPTSPKEYGYDS